MIKISMAVEDLENIVDIVLRYSEMSLKKRSVITVNVADKSMSLVNEIVHLNFREVFDVGSNDQKVQGFSFDVRSISKLKYPEKTVQIEYIEKIVYISCGRLKVNIRSDYSYEPFKERKIDVLESLEIDNGALLKAIQKMKLPYAFYKGDPNKSAIKIRGMEGRAIFEASDGYSLCRFTTRGNSNGDFEVSLPRITLSSFLTKRLEKAGTTKFEVQEMSVKITTGSLILITSQVNEMVDDFGEVLKNLGTWSYSSQLTKKELNNAIKSISGSINDKKSVNYLSCKIKPGTKSFDLNYNNSKTGGISYTDIPFDGLEFYEQGAHLVVNLHAKSFEDFTSLLDSSFQWWGNKRAVYYQETGEVGSIEYMFPTVSI